MGSFGKYGRTDIPIGGVTGGTDLYHHDPPPKVEGGIQGYWFCGGDMEYDHHYHKQPLQDGHLYSWFPARVKLGKEDGQSYVGGQTGATYGRNMSQIIDSGVPVCEEVLLLLGSNVVHGNTAGVWALEEPTKAPVELLGRSYGDHKVCGVLCPPVWYVTGGYPWVPIVLYYLQHIGWCGSAFHDDGAMQNPGGLAWTDVGSRVSGYNFLGQWWPYCG